MDIELKISKRWGLKNSVIKKIHCMSDQDLIDVWSIVHKGRKPNLTKNDYKRI